jgi:hypothetical protein
LATTGRGDALNTSKTEAKYKAIEQFKERCIDSDLQPKIVNESLPAGSNVFFYCVHCGIFLESLLEDYLFPPYQECSQCKGLEGEEWMEEAKESRNVPIRSLRIVSADEDDENFIRDSAFEDGEWD